MPEKELQKSKFSWIDSYIWLFVIIECELLTYHTLESIGIYFFLLPLILDTIDACSHCFFYSEISRVWNTERCQSYGLMKCREDLRGRLETLENEEDKSEWGALGYSYNSPLSIKLEHSSLKVIRGSYYSGYSYLKEVSWLHSTDFSMNDFIFMHNIVIYEE